MSENQCHPSARIRFFVDTYRRTCEECMRFLPTKGYYPQPLTDEELGL